MYCEQRLSRAGRDETEQRESEVKKMQCTMCELGNMRETPPYLDCEVRPKQIGEMHG